MTRNDERVHTCWECRYTWRQQYPTAQRYVKCPRCGSTKVGVDMGGD